MERRLEDAGRENKRPFGLLFGATLAWFADWRALSEGPVPWGDVPWGDNPEAGLRGVAEGYTICTRPPKEAL